MSGGDRSWQYEREQRERRRRLVAILLVVALVMGAGLATLLMVL